MSFQSDILNVFRGSGQIQAVPPLLLDLTLWHKWHSRRGSLPAGFGRSLSDTCRALGVPTWAPFHPWRIEYDGVALTTEETSSDRTIVYHTTGRTLTAQWTLGPDGDWWQIEYPVKDLDDLRAAAEVAAARRYVVDTAGLDAWRAEVGEVGVTALELPMRPYSDLLHSLIGWGEGILLLRGEGKPVVEAILSDWEARLQHLVSEVAALPGELVLSPDNLDGQYIPPRVFQEHLATSYATTANICRQQAKPLVIHVGGPARRLVPLLAEAGVDGIEGIAGPPQSDVTLDEARAAAGPGITLWGGIPQDLLIDEHEESAFEASVLETVSQAGRDPRTIIGIADRVPVNASVERLTKLVSLVRG